MKKIAIVIFIILGCNIFIGKAQERGFQISGKIDGILEGTLFLMSDEKGKLEVLDTTSIMNGAFVFTGKVERPLSAYIMVPNSKNYIPLILENVNFMLNIGKTGVLIKGGEQQDILNQFSKINIDLLEGQNRIQEEFKQAQQKGDKKKMQILQKQLENVLENTLQQEKMLLQKYSNSYAAAYVIFHEMKQLEERFLIDKYMLLTKEAQETVPGRIIKTYIEEWECLTEGNVAPDFTLFSSTGDSLSLYPLKGKLKLVHFWSCEDIACSQENVELLDLYQRYHLKGLEVIGVFVGNDKQKWRKTLIEDGMIWIHGFDENHRVADLYHVKKLPTIILLDAENQIIAKNLFGKDLQRKIGEFLKKSK